jgi:hypothetical protein
LLPAARRDIVKFYGSVRRGTGQEMTEAVAGKEEIKTLKKTARTAGILILIIAVFGPFSMMYVPSTLIVPGDAATTARNITASEGLFRLGIVSDSIVFLLEIAIVVTLYVLLRPVSKTLSLVAASGRLAMTVVQGVNVLNSYAALRLLSGADYLTVLEPGQPHALMMLFLDVHEFLVLVWGLFFGLHLFFLGYLVYKSGYIPRILGVLLVFSSLCYFTQSWGSILLPEYRETFAFIGLLSAVELAFALWLVIKGVRERQPDTAQSNVLNEA